MNARTALLRIGTILAAVFLTAGVRAAEGRALSFEQRVEAQRAIEQVYWNHRIWPKENPAPKPPLEAVLSRDAIRAKVEAYLRQSNALEMLWQRPIISTQLQKEMERMARESRQPALLSELFAALGNDPALIAETLVRQKLADRLIRGWYESDDRFHGGTEQAARQALASMATLDPVKLAASGAQYDETTWVRRAASPAAPDRPSFFAEPGELDSDRWTGLLDDLARRFGRPVHALPAGTMSELQESGEAFEATTILQAAPGSITVASKCGYTPQYEGLEKLYEGLKGQGFSILGFPSNDFGGQEPGSPEEIRTFCSTKYNVTFPIFEKVQTKAGEGQSPIYANLQTQAGELPGWNFCKYLVGKDGKVVKFYKSAVKPDDEALRKDIENALK